MSCDEDVTRFWRGLALVLGGVLLGRTLTSATAILRRRRKRRPSTLIGRLLAIEALLAIADARLAARQARLDRLFARWDAGASS